MTSVAASTGLSGGGSSGAVSLAVSYLPAVDDRDMKPNTSGIGSSTKGVKPFFSSLGGMTGTANGDYQDVLVLDTYSDTSGGNANALTFDKSEMKIRHWQASQTATSWGTSKTLAYFDDIPTNNNELTNGAGYLTAHPSISAASSVNNSGRTYIQDITLDSNGHITAITSATETVTNTDTQLTDAQVRSKISGTGLISYNSSTGVISTTANNYSLPAGSSSTRGGFKIGYTENGKNYPVEVSSEKMFVNVPWTDNNTTYSAGTGVTLSGTTFSIGQSVATNATVQFGLVRSTGDVVAYYSSDERLKDNFKPLTGALDKVNKLGGYEFDWNDKQDTYEAGTHSIGVKAQEVQEQYPDLVVERENGYLAVDYIKMNAVLIEAVKELSAKVEALEAKLK